MKQRLLSLGYGLIALLAGPTLTLAQEAAEMPKARLAGFSREVAVEPSSPAMLWLLAIVLAAICVAVLFKDAKRSHLD